jgi:hypothetical protein
MGVAFRPSIFRAKGSPAGLTYPVWTNDKDPKLRYGATVISLIPVQGILSFAERHLVAKYRNIQVMIGGRIYFVSQKTGFQKIPMSSERKSLAHFWGIPKVPDGFNIW